MRAIDLAERGSGSEWLTSQAREGTDVCAGWDKWILRKSESPWADSLWNLGDRAAVQPRSNASTSSQPGDPESQNFLLVSFDLGSHHPSEVSHHLHSCTVSLMLIVLSAHLTFVSYGMFQAPCITLCQESEHSGGGRGFMLPLFMMKDSENWTLVQSTNYWQSWSKPLFEP